MNTYKYTMLAIVAAVLLLSVVVTAEEQHESYDESSFSEPSSCISSLKAIKKVMTDAKKLKDVCKGDDMTNIEKCCDDLGKMLDDADSIPLACVPSVMKKDLQNGETIYKGMCGGSDSGFTDTSEVSGSTFTY
eukprot:TRINITY_DN17536_c0_g1_i1.p1 TRINITY_DN17536_c0_g1~~TRINITY_DN17536_c0_g1_i1.p1  ORF type:complete len:133 (-),score=46.56 TRINITY_DN17536_c0_g1_i1:27-425(-)